MIDEATIEARAGDGGNGAVMFLREAMQPLGGPSGGNGGRGGSVYLYPDQSLNTLLKFRWQKRFIAGNGGRGSKNKRRGANGDDVTVAVPFGTEVWQLSPRRDEPDVFLGDMVEPGQKLLVARGGNGGNGNASSVTPTNRQPLLAEAGEAGQTVRLRLNLRLLADVGIIGMPNAGKSSLLAAMSAARPKIADYPFTTIDPMIGLVQHGFDAFTVVDVPGLIEGAAQGSGLGHEFLKHAQRTRLLIHVVDGSAWDIVENIHAIDHEIALYDEAMTNRPQIIAINKSDLEEVSVLRTDIEQIVRAVSGDERPIHFISATTRKGVDQLIVASAYKLTEIRDGTEKGDGNRTRIISRDDGLLDRDDLPTVRPAIQSPSFVKQTDGSFRIVHQRAVRLAQGSNLDDWEALVQFQNRLDRMQISDSLRRAGISAGDTVLIDDWEFEWQ